MMDKNFYFNLLLFFEYMEVELLFCKLEILHFVKFNC